MEFPYSVILRGGAKALILYQVAEGNKPLIGAYFSGSNWIPVSWTMNGRYDPKEELEYNQDIARWLGEE